MNTQNFIMMPIPADMFTAVCALLGGALTAPAIGYANASNVNKSGNDAASADIGARSVGSKTVAQEKQASDGTGETAQTDASLSDGEVDAHGHPWSEEMHASTRGKTKDGLWRMKIGVSRPDPLPGHPVDVPTGTAETGEDSQSGPSATTETAPSSEDDEFAAFRQAAEASNATDVAAAASVPARVLSDADLGALCNQAAVKLGDPSPVKEIIAQYVPQGEVAHSRNIPEDKRDEFAKAVEAKAGIEFAG